MLFRMLNGLNQGTTLRGQSDSLRLDFIQKVMSLQHKILVANDSQHSLKYTTHLVLVQVHSVNFIQSVHWGLQCGQARGHSVIIKKSSAFGLSISGLLRCFAKKTTGEAVRYSRHFRHPDI
jgi:hypothetical protein